MIASQTDFKVEEMGIAKLTHRTGFEVRVQHNKKRLTVYLPSVTKRQAEDFERLLKQLVAVKETGGITVQPRCVNNW